MAWTVEKNFCVPTYIETKSYKVVQTRFCRKFNFNTFLEKSQIFLWYHNFQTYGTVDKRSKKTENPSSVRKLSARSADNVQASRVSVGRSPKKSIRRRSSELGISRSSLHRILTQDLHLYPYRIQIKHKLTTTDMQKRVEMCHWFQNTIECDPEFLNHVWFSDEAHFMLSSMSTARIIYSGVHKHQKRCFRGHYTLKCTAWVAISKHGIIGPYWFEDDNEKALTVTKERYIAVLNKFWMNLESQQEINQICSGSNRMEPLHIQPISH